MATELDSALLENEHRRNITSSCNSAQSFPPQFTTSTVDCCTIPSPLNLLFVDDGQKLSASVVASYSMSFFAFRSLCVCVCQQDHNIL